MNELRHLLDVSDLTPDSALAIMDTAETFVEVSRRPLSKVPSLRGKTVLNVFYEASTRTRTSFELAGKRLSADVINISAASSSTKKGESLKDTVRTLSAMHPDVLVLRHGSSGAAAYAASESKCPVINAGDGMHAHPTQALLDAFTIRKHRGTIAGAVVAICGDIAHSRVARSNALLLMMLGARVRFVGPRTLLPPEMGALGAELFHSLAAGLEGADVVMVLRVQLERLRGALLPSLREYSRTFGINVCSLSAAKPDAIVMHPGPINRGVEIDPAVADGSRSLILDQVEAGVAIRMALLHQFAGDDSVDLRDSQ